MLPYLVDRLLQRIRLRFRPAEDSLQVAALGEVLAGTTRIARAGSLRRFRNITAGADLLLLVPRCRPACARPAGACGCTTAPGIAASGGAARSGCRRRRPGRPPPARSAERGSVPGMPAAFRTNDAGHLEIDGCDVVSLAEEFGAPLWVISESTVRDNYRRLRDAFQRVYPATDVLVRHEGQPAAGHHRGRARRRARSSTPSRSAT